MDKIIIKDLVARGVIGVDDWERDILQEILINIVAYTDTQKAGELDDIQYSVDYRALSMKVLKHAELVGRLSVEALAEDIAHISLAQPNVQKVQVRVEKPGAIRFAKSVGIEIKRSHKKDIGITD